MPSYFCLLDGQPVGVVRNKNYPNRVPDRHQSQNPECVIRANDGSRLETIEEMAVNTVHEGSKYAVIGQHF